MHHGKSGEIVGCGRRRAGEHIGIDLRPAEPEHAADHPHQAVFHVGELRRLLRALAIDHDECMLVGREGPVIVVASEDGVVVALAGAARPVPIKASVTEPSLS